MKAIILSAGYGTRLYPLTLNKPKPLLKVGGKSIIEHIIEKLDPIPSLNEIYIITNNKFFSHFQQWANNFNSEKIIKIINDNTTSDENRLGALGDIKFAITKENINEDILIFGGDNLFEDGLEPMHDFFKTKGTSVVGFNDVKDLEIAKRMGVALLNPNQKIIEFVEKPPAPKSTFVSTLVYFLKKEDLHLIDECLKLEEGSKEVKAGELIAFMIKKTAIHGYVFNKRWFDIGNLEQLKQADECWSKK